MKPKPPAGTGSGARVASSAPSISVGSSSSVGSMPRALLRGHTGSVTCLAVPAPTGGSSPSSSSPLLLSGSSDSTVRLWDRRTEKSARCLTSFCKGDISAVAFGAGDYDILCTANRTVYRFDLRATRDIIVRSAASSLRANGDEINCLSLSSEGRYLAAADDAGAVQLLDIATGEKPRVWKSLTGKHSSLCTAVAFRPYAASPVAAAASSSASSSSATCSSSPSEVWSGGMDSTVLCWSLPPCGSSAGASVLKSFSTQVTAQTAGGNSSQTLNPPFVNSLCFHPSGSHVFAGSGNAEILLFDARRKVEQLRVQGHTHSVMHVGVVQLPTGFQGRPSFASQQCLLSAGNDQNILLWDIQQLLDGASASSGTTKAAAAASSVSSATAKNRRKKERARAKKKAAANAAATAGEGDAAATAEGEDEEEEDADSIATVLQDASISASAAAAAVAPIVFTGALLSTPHLPPTLAFSALESSALDTPLIRYRWRHPEKMNALVTASGGGSGMTQTEGFTVYVADTTKDITAYYLR